MIRICKILKLIYNSGDYYVFSAWCGKRLVLTYKGDNPPKPLKTVDYKVIGDVEHHKKHGSTLSIKEYEKIGKVKVYKKPLAHY